MGILKWLLSSPNNNSAANTNKNPYQRPKSRSERIREKDRHEYEIWEKSEEYEEEEEL